MSDAAPLVEESTEAEEERKTSYIELFFDLVFVFAFTQVTTLLSDQVTWSALGHGVLLVAVLWWSWAGYAWLTNNVNPDEGAVRAAVLVSIGALFVAALAVPDAFGRHALTFAIAFLIVQLVHLALLAYAGRHDSDLLRGVLRIAPVSLAASILLVIAGCVDGRARTGLWLAALVVSFGGSAIIGVTGWRVRPSHFAERHSLIVIIAIGESFVAIGLGARGTDLGAGVVVAAMLGLVVAASLWLAYFDFFVIRAERLVAERSGREQTALARDLYTYLHLPMIIGIVLFALAMKKTLAHHAEEIGTVEAFALCGGCAVYLGAYVGLRWYLSRRLGRGRLVATVALAALFPVALVVPALAALALVAAVWVALHAYELIWWREARAQTRGLRAPAAAS
jgi:low temperature requirement protein LtrA